jgi:hypothetical protein
VRPTDERDFDKLLDAAAYKKLLDDA